MAIYLNSYYPLEHTNFGRKAIEQFGFHPLVDGSIRREPDFEHPLSPISGLCRPGRMANFGPSDFVIYKTNRSHILTAILEIDRRFDDHQQAANWLVENEYPIPTNNILSDPLPLDYSHAHRYMKTVGRREKLDHAIHYHWNATYLDRASRPKSSYFFTTKSLYNAVVSKVNPDKYIYLGDLLRTHMGQIPRTNWRPEPIPTEVLDEILKLSKKGI